LTYPKKSYTLGRRLGMVVSVYYKKATLESF